LLDRVLCTEIVRSVSADEHEPFDARVERQVLPHVEAAWIAPLQVVDEE
jgi:hypothetical protein